MEKQEMADHENPAVSLGQRDQFLSVLRTESQRLFDEHVLAGKQNLFRQFEMPDCRGGDDDGMDGWLAEQIVKARG